MTPLAWVLLLAGAPLLLAAVAALAWKGWDAEGATEGER